MENKNIKKILILFEIYETENYIIIYYSNILLNWLLLLEKRIDE